MEKKPTRFLPDYVSKQCHNSKCNRQELHRITIEKEVANNHFILIIKCMGCGKEAKFHHIKGGQ